MKEKLLQLYIEALDEATSFFLSDYANTTNEWEERKKSDKEQIEYFKSLLNQL